MIYSPRSPDLSQLKIFHRENVKHKEFQISLQDTYSTTENKHNTPDNWCSKSQRNRVAVNVLKRV